MIIFHEVMSENKFDYSYTLVLIWLFY